MRLLVDTDIFCKLGIADLLDEALGEFEATRADCLRLPALPYMLRRGSLVRRFGQDQCARLQELASTLAPLGTPSDEWLSVLVEVHAVDAGEAQLLATAAGGRAILFSGDKRALRAVAGIPGIHEPLRGRVVVLEALLLALCQRYGADRIRGSVASLTAYDHAIRICFSATNPDPATALRSYFDHLSAEVAPLELWQPPPP